MGEGVISGVMSSDIDVSSGEVAPNGGARPAEAPARTSDRGAATRGALLAAARDVFCESGFAQAAVTDIVAKAGASVGSLYHHFNGKADLYLTLFEDFQG